MSKARDEYYRELPYDEVIGNDYIARKYIKELEQQNDYLIEALIKEVKQSYEETGSYSNLSMQVLRNITKKTAEEILTGGER